MKKIILIHLFLLVNGAELKGQTIPETIEFINEKIFESTKSVLDLRFINRVTLTPKGKFVIENYIYIAGEWVLLESRAGFLKSINFSEWKQVKYENGGSHYALVLECDNESSCISRQVKSQSNTSNLNDMTIMVYNYQCAEKIVKAFQHLKVLSENNKNYLRKEMF